MAVGAGVWVGGMGVGEGSAVGVLVGGTVGWVVLMMAMGVGVGSGWRQAISKMGMRRR